VANRGVQWTLKSQKFSEHLVSRSAVPVWRSGCWFWTIEVECDATRAVPSESMRAFSSAVVLCEAVQ
jgi:hypothetical protein